MTTVSYNEVAIEHISDQISRNIILLVTATDLESRELHKIIKPFPDSEQILRVYSGGLTYYFGVFGNYKIAHVQCSMGSVSRNSSITTVSEALETLKTKVVIMPGVAFGADDLKQKIGDVLVAEAIQPYNNKRVGVATEIPRAYAMPSSKVLLNRFKNLKSWEYLLPDMTRAKLILSLVLSGEELIDNKRHRDDLLLKYPNAAGGEMEGAGVYSACDGKAQCILVKGICDFADGMKGKDKEKNQCIAIESALSVCMDLFSSKTAFTELGISSLAEHMPDYRRDAGELNGMLFEVYDQSKEKFYIEREADSSFLNIVSHYGAWVYGPSGCGKSSMISRNLIQAGLPFIQVNLASCVGSGIEEFFTEILFDLASKIEGVNSYIQPAGFPECIRLILNLLAKYYTNRELVIFIEEIPLDTSEDHRIFAQKIYSLLVSKSFFQGLENVKIILSSINNPAAHVQPYNQKIYIQFKFIELRYWNTPDITKLLELIKNAIKLDIDEKLTGDIISRSKKSPRFIKKLFRNLLLLNRYDIVTLRESLTETERELN